MARKPQRRDKLKDHNGERGRYRGTFVRMGRKAGWTGEMLHTVCLAEIRDAETGELMCDHCWLNYTQGFQALSPLVPGDVLEFDARVRPYTRGYMGYREDPEAPLPHTDYKLARPTQIVRLDPVLQYA